MNARRFLLQIAQALVVTLVMGVIILSYTGLPLADAAKPDFLTLTQTGSPIWKPVDFHMFSAPTGTSKTGFAEVLDTILALLPEPNHTFIPELGAGPGEPHDPPYDSELADGVRNLGFAEKVEFSSKEFSRGNGVYLVWMNIPDPGTTGSSPDFASGPIIPNSLFPIETCTTVTRDDGARDGPSCFLVPPLTEEIDSRFRDLDGHSHFPVFLAETAEFFPPFPDPHPQGDYQYEVEITDQEENGWKIVARFEIK
jgi:hypothetical protein